MRTQTLRVAGGGHKWQLCNTVPTVSHGKNVLTTGLRMSGRSAVTRVPYNCALQMCSTQTLLESCPTGILT